jgi:hypothetical protein
MLDPYILGKKAINSPWAVYFFSLWGFLVITSLIPQLLNIIMIWSFVFWVVVKIWEEKSPVKPYN